MFTAVIIVSFKAAFTFGARALVPELRKKMCSDTGNSKDPSTMHPGTQARTLRPIVGVQRELFAPCSGCTKCERVLDKTLYT